MRGAVKVAAGGASALAAFVAMAGPAWARQDVTVDVYCPQPFCETVTWAGWGGFASNGDMIRACDLNPDGFGVEAKLDISRDGDYDRTATTRGHAADYCSPWRPGDIREGTPVTIRVCLVNGDFEFQCRTGDGVA